MSSVQLLYVHPISIRGEYLLIVNRSELLSICILFPIYLSVHIRYPVTCHDGLRQLRYMSIPHWIVDFRCTGYVV